MTKQPTKADLAKDAKPQDNPLRADETSGKTREANEASDTKPKAKPADTFDPEQYAAYNQGRQARRGSIAIDDCPHGDGKDKDAWLAGYAFEDKAIV